MPGHSSPTWSAHNRRLQTGPDIRRLELERRRPSGAVTAQPAGARGWCHAFR